MTDKADNPNVVECDSLEFLALCARHREGAVRITGVAQSKEGGGKIWRVTIEKCLPKHPNPK